MGLVLGLRPGLGMARLGGVLEWLEDLVGRWGVVPDGDLVLVGMIMACRAGGRASNGGGPGGRPGE